MKISNFKFIERKGDSVLNYEYFATVDIETGHLWWKKKETKKITKPYVGSWFFVDTGEFTPGYIVANLARSYSAKNNVEF